MKIISSSHNSKYRKWKDLAESSGVKKYGEFLVCGQKLVPEVLQSHPHVIREVILFDPDDREVIPLASDVPVYLVDKKLFKQVDVFGTRFPIAVGQFSEIKHRDLNTPAEGLEVICSLGDPTNLGSLLRSCEAFGVKHVTLLESSAHPFHPKAFRVSSGSGLNLNIHWGPRIQDLHSSQLVGLDMEGQSIYDFDWPENLRIIMGEEGLGLPKELQLDQKLKIPMKESLESLNATVATSLALFSYRKQFPL